MTRAIRFRAWDGLRMFFYADQGKMGRLDVSWEGHDTELILMQFTGLLDKNGKEIYEGDVIKHENEQISVMEWSEGDWGWFMRSVKNWNPKTHFDSSKDEIIGNIYEDSQLLELRK